MGPRPSGRGTHNEGKSVLSEIARQWGRGRVAAERNPDKTDLEEALEASMGPRPSGRGTQLLARFDSRLVWRQWGRGRVAA